jgi:hypothetical protein
VNNPLFIRNSTKKKNSNSNLISLITTSSHMGFQFPPTDLHDHFSPKVFSISRALLLLYRLVLGLFFLLLFPSIIPPDSLFCLACFVVCLLRLLISWVLFEKGGPPPPPPAQQINIFFKEIYLFTYLFIFKKFHHPKSKP